MADDLRAEIEAALVRLETLPVVSGDSADGGHVTIRLADLMPALADLRALLAAHPVQGEVAARAYFGEGYEFALVHLDDEPVQADLARLRPDRPVAGGTT